MMQTLKKYPTNEFVVTLRRSSSSLFPPWFWHHRLLSILPNIWWISEEPPLDHFLILFPESNDKNSLDFFFFIPAAVVLAL